jgi:hypothetical protein
VYSNFTLSKIIFLEMGNPRDPCLFSGIVHKGGSPSLQEKKRRVEEYLSVR